MTPAAENLRWIIPLLLIFTGWIIIQALYDVWSKRRAARRCQYITRNRKGSD